MAGRHRDVHEQPVPVLHQCMRRVTEPALLARRLAVQPRFGVGDRPVGRVRALLAPEVHARIAGIVVVGTIADLLIRRILRSEALHRAVALDQRSVDREVVQTGELLRVRTLDHAIEERADERVLLKALPVGRKAARVPHRCVQRQVQEPPVQQVHPDLLHQAALRTHGVQRLQQQRLEQHLGRDARSSQFGVRAAELPIHPGKHLVRAPLHLAQRVVLIDQALDVDRVPKGLLRADLSAHRLLRVGVPHNLLDRGPVASVFFSNLLESAARG